MKKLTSSTIVVCIHLQIHPHFAHTNSLHQISAVFFFFFWGGGGGGAIVYYIVQYINYYAHVFKLKVFWLQQVRTRPPLSLYV
jgi:hypothetical protein